MGRRLLAQPIVIEVFTGRGNIYMTIDFSLPAEKADFKVVFWGQATAGVSRAELASGFAKLFKVRSEQQLKRFFTGRLVILKSGLTEAKARAYVRAIEAIGGACRIERNQLATLDGELARRHKPSFLRAGLSSDQMSLAPIEHRLPDAKAKITQTEKRTVFEAREVNSRF